MLLLNGEITCAGTRGGTLSLRAYNFEVPADWPALLVRVLETLQGRKEASGDGPAAV